MSDPATSRPMSPTAIPVADAARLLSAAGGHSVTPEQIQADLAAGAPVNPDGTVNLVHYAAWLVRQSVVRSPESGAPGRAPAQHSEGYGLQTADYGLNDGD